MQTNRMETNGMVANGTESKGMEAKGRRTPAVSASARTGGQGGHLAHSRSGQLAHSRSGQLAHLQLAHSSWQHQSPQRGKLGYGLPGMLQVMVLAVLALAVAVRAVTSASVLDSEIGSLAHAWGDGREDLRAVRLTGEAGEEDIALFLDWLQSQGVSLHKVAVTDFVDGKPAPHLGRCGAGYHAHCHRGVVATEEIGKGEVIARIPHNATLIWSDVPGVSNVRVPPPHPDADGFEHIVAWMLRELALGPRSRFAPFLRTLEPSSGTFHSMTEEELGAIQILNTRHRADARLERLRLSFNSSDPRALAHADFDTYRWAAGHCHTRILGAPFPFPSPFPHADGGSGSSSGSGGSSGSGSGSGDGGGGGGGSANTTRVGELRQLVPLIGFISSAATERLANAGIPGVKPGESSQNVTATRKIKVGEEILVAYHRDLSNEDWFSLYGFVPEKNSCDFLPLFPSMEFFIDFFISTSPVLRKLQEGEEPEEDVPPILSASRAEEIVTSIWAAYNESQEEDPSPRCGSNVYSSADRLWALESGKLSEVGLAIYAELSRAEEEVLHQSARKSTSNREGVGAPTPTTNTAGARPPPIALADFRAPDPHVAHAALMFTTYMTMLQSELGTSIEEDKELLERARNAVGHKKGRKRAALTPTMVNIVSYRLATKLQLKAAHVYLQHVISEHKLKE